MLDNQAVRRELAKSFTGFCLVYLSHYFWLEPATFHHELLGILSDQKERMIEIIGARDTAKSTFGSLALPLWAALEKPEVYPFILPIADTAPQAALNIANIKNELENNTLILTDYGKVNSSRHLHNPDPTLESDEEWQAKNMLLNNGVRITARSRGQKIRGMRHRQYRPKLVVVDDPEDTKWVRFKENRDETEKWFRGEVIPALDSADSKLVLIGNYLHDDALMKRMAKADIFRVLEYPLVNADGECLWPAKYPTQEAIEQKMREAGPVAWQREYMLKPVASEGAPIKPEDIHYYDEMPVTRRGRRGHGVDLAISTKASADYTAIVDGDVAYTEDGRGQIYVRPSPLNKRMEFYETLEAIKGRWNQSEAHIFFVEAVSYQKAAIEALVRIGVPNQPMQPTTDKRSRLLVAATYIKNGTVLFPRTGCEELIGQLLNFGVEAHDDMVDALVYLILGLVEGGMDLPRVTWI